MSDIYLLSEIHGQLNSGYLSTGYSQRIANYINSGGAFESGYAKNHIGREYYRKLFNFGMSHLISDDYDAGFRPITLDALSSAFDISFTSTTLSLGLSVFLRNPDYTGYCMKVRREEDDSEQDFGFANGVLNTGAMMTFVGTGNGRVVKWYSQDPNNRDFQKTTSSTQPYIIKSGAVNNIKGVPAIDFDPGTAYGAQYYLDSVSTGLFEGFTGMSMMVVASVRTPQYGGHVYVNSSNSATHTPYPGGSYYEGFCTTTRKDAIFTPETGYLDSGYYYSVNSYTNNWSARFCSGKYTKSYGTNAFTTAAGKSYLAYNQLGNAFRGDISEILFFSTDLNAGSGLTIRNNLEEDIRNNYNFNY